MAELPWLLAETNFEKKFQVRFQLPRAKQVISATRIRGDAVCLRDRGRLRRTAEFANRANRGSEDSLWSDEGVGIGPLKLPVAGFGHDGVKAQTYRGRISEPTIETSRHVDEDAREGH